VPNTHTLLGVLELGERSAALFEIQGVPQRVYIGERIGDSGWSLVSVANEEAVVRRNGEVRTLYIGQNF
jgi:Tfp pilus assembly protein PilP